jgi:hypothetical protein
VSQGTNGPLQGPDRRQSRIYDQEAGRGELPAVVGNLNGRLDHGPMGQSTPLQLER